MNLVDYITKFSDGYHLPLDIVLGIARTESNMEMHAIRAEPLFRWTWNCETNRPFRRLTDDEILSNSAPVDFPRPTTYFATEHTEWQGQRMSWGPFQMMGTLLRERGFYGPFPQICCDPETAARFACAHISSLRDRYLDKHGWQGVVAAYNAGRPRKDVEGKYVNYEYVNKVSKAGGRKYLGFIQA